MKPSILGLLIAAVALGASTIYLSVQLQEERAQADKVAETMRTLNARIAELEKMRETRFASSGVFGAGALEQGMSIGPPPPPAEKAETKTDFTDVVAIGGPPPPRSEAFQKMMRSQVRANNKRIYADLGTKLGLSKEDTSRLIDMLTDQQVDRFGRMSEVSADPVERQRAIEDARRDHQAEIENFLGASKTAALRDYQETIPARQEVEAIARQLEGSDATLSEDQQQRMLAALVEERKRIPMPKMSDITTPEEYSKAYAEWQSGYDERVNSQVHGILNSEQTAAYSEYQQWQKEMREQVVTRRAGRGNNIMFSTVAAPIAGEAVILVAPPPEEKPRKP
jgi:outer membrane murein-binding lipoprotein Lpp